MIFFSFAYIWSFHFSFFNHLIANTFFFSVKKSHIEKLKIDRLKCRNFMITPRNGPGIPHWEYGRVGSSSHPIRMEWEELPSRHHLEEICYHPNTFHSNGRQSRYRPIRMKKSLDTIPFFRIGLGSFSRSQLHDIAKI